MNKYFTYLCVTFILTLFPLGAEQHDLRILELLPDLCCPLAVTPNIPSDFVALSPSDEINLYDWVYWGPKDVLEAYFKDQSSLKTPILKVVLSGNVTQTGPNSFSESSAESLEMLKKEDPASFVHHKAKWGNYPIQTIKTKLFGKTIYMAWVGLNDPAGWTLAFNLVYPGKDPSEKDIQLWENFLKGTKQLSEREYFKAYGQDLQDGYTIVSVGGAKLKMIAEKRQSDGTVQVVVIPESSGTEFHYIDMMEGLMGAKWKYGEPIVKVFGEIVANHENTTNVMNYTTTILLKTVQEFSFKKEDNKNLLIKNPLIFQKRAVPNV